MVSVSHTVKRSLLAAVLIAASVTGCASMEETMRQPFYNVMYEGKPLQKLIAAYGRPTGSARDGDGKMIYRFIDTKYSQPFTEYTGVGYENGRKIQYYRVLRNVSDHIYDAKVDDDEQQTVLSVTYTVNRRQIQE